ncbi:hypothetical protein CH63R_07456 [Colletotrichum higginsianum IMI 349063]|uniref:Uncharacterized protein n=1 Tax=Colletotrichum higginsianum (strain IMI 349063) TaxID=759273 RepID=A0A1B7Y9D1_COLHI|nr:hypothetical protein CH63R_07456 [Colletotrichum higginsianum IMI 349063]OBR08691.1 hypothetical protein CH63R_07456 [Colletotrichum higginsianum IMI 349063]
MLLLLDDDEDRPRFLKCWDLRSSAADFWDDKTHPTARTAKGKEGKADGTRNTVFVDGLCFGLLHWHQRPGCRAMTSPTQAPRGWLQTSRPTNTTRSRASIILAEGWANRHIIAYAYNPEPLVLPDQ